MFFTVSATRYYICIELIIVNSPPRYEQGGASEQDIEISAKTNQPLKVL
jgi:hypothetical protein